MKGKSPCQSELNLFEPILRQIVVHDHPLVKMADTFPWKVIESEYSALYSDKGAPAKPVRLMVGLLVLKHIFNGSDEGVVNEWKRDSYFQYFCGGNVKISILPCDPSDMAHFRRRIGSRRLNNLMHLSAKYQRKSGMDRLKIDWDIKPGQDNFSYTLNSGFYKNLLRTFTGLADKVSRVVSGA
jgi:transposase, IS5 family